MNSTVTPFLWMESAAAEAAKFHCDIFPNSKIIHEAPMMVIYEVAGQRIMALNGGAHFKLNQAFSLYVDCKDQSEIDYYWERLSPGATQMRCGWITDKFGVTWQIVPDVLSSLIGDPDKQKRERAFSAMMKMEKLDIAKLKAAHAGI